MPASRTKNTLLALFALIAVAACGLAWSQYRELIKLRGEALGDSARGDLQKRLWALEKRNHELEAEVAELRTRETGEGLATANGEEDPAAENAAADQRRTGRFNPRRGFAGFTTLMDNPQFAKLWTDQQKARISDAFKPLFKRLNLTPDQADKLQSLLAERQSSFMDALAVARSQGITSPADIRQLVQQTNSQIDSQIQSLLGPDGYAQYTGYLQTLPQLNQVGQLQARLAASGAAPLQDYQVQQLAQILAQNSATAGSGGARGGGYFGAMGGMFGPPVTGPAITSSAVTQAAGLLTADQLQALQQMQQEQATQQQLRNALRQTFRSGQGAAGVGAAAAGSASAPASTAPPVSRPGGG